MKRILILGAFALMSATIFSCTADDYVSSDATAEIKKEIIPAATSENAYANEGPGDAPIPVPPPK